jgi:hypothetical protein
MFDRFMMEEQFGWRVEKHCPEAIRLLDTEDLSCLRHARHQACKHSGEVSLTVGPALLFSDHAKREVAAILRSDLTLMISRAEIDLLTSAFKVDPALLHYSPFMLPPLNRQTTEQLPTFEQREHFLAIGNFRHAPNWDAVLWLKQSIWPLVRQQLPQAELHIYGTAQSETGLSGKGLGRRRPRSDAQGANQPGTAALWRRPERQAGRRTGLRHTFRDHLRGCRRNG